MYKLPVRKQGNKEHRQACRDRVADSCAERLPAGMSDVDRDRVRVAAEAADDRGNAVGEHDLSRLVLVPCGMRTLDVFQVKNIVGQPERYSRSQVRQRVRNPLNQAVNVHRRRIEAKRLHGSSNRGPILQAECPGEHSACRKQKEACSCLWPYAWIVSVAACFPVYFTSFTARSSCLPQRRGLSQAHPLPDSR